MAKRAMIQRTYRVPEDDYERAMARAEAEGVNLSEAVLRQAVIDYSKGRKLTRFP